MQTKRKLYTDTDCYDTQNMLPFKRSNRMSVPEKRKLSLHHQFQSCKRYRGATCPNNTATKRGRDEMMNIETDDIDDNHITKRFKNPRSIPAHRIDMDDLRRIVHNYGQLEKKLEQTQQENKHLRAAIEAMSMQLSNISNNNFAMDCSIYRKYGYSY